MLLIQQIEKFKDKLQKNTAFGVFSKTNDPAFIEIMGHAGFDFVILDLEHGPNSVENLQNLIRAAQISELLPIVRVKENNLSVIGEVLDIGAAGIQVPQITSAVEAQGIVNIAKFSPEGMRGVCRFVRAAGYSSMDRFKYFSESNKTLIILQLEGKEAIANLDEILDFVNVDVLFIGPYDLSQNLGVAGQIDHPAVESKMKEIIHKCAKKNMVVGTFVDNIKNAKKWEEAGVKYIAYSVDMGLFYEQCYATVKTLRGR